MAGQTNLRPRQGPNCPPASPSTLQFSRNTRARFQPGRGCPRWARTHPGAREKKGRASFISLASGRGARRGTSGARDSFPALKNVRFQFPERPPTPSDGLAPSFMRPAFSPCGRAAGGEAGPRNSSSQVRAPPAGIYTRPARFFPRAPGRFCCARRW